jgi:hypothetical protein
VRRLLLLVVMLFGVVTFVNAETKQASDDDQSMEYVSKKKETFHTAPVKVRMPDSHPESVEFYPTALVADKQIVTYIAGTPVVTSPYLGARPAFDGSDYIVNISSINRDVRMMEQRRRLYNAYDAMGYPVPDRPILILSGKTQPLATISWNPNQQALTNLDIGANELDVAAALNDVVEAYMGIAYISAPPFPIEGPRVANSYFGLNLGFVNIGDLDKTPFYFTAGQLFVPFGRYSSSMISATLPMMLSRTLSRPVILGYRSQSDHGGPYAAVYAFNTDTTIGSSNVGGANAGYILDTEMMMGDFGVGFIGSLADSQGMQNNGLGEGFFGGFSSANNGSEDVQGIPGLDVHANLSVGRYNVTGEWVTATKPFRSQDLSFNGYGAQPQAFQVEASATFKAFDRPASLGFGYQTTKQALALNLPKNRWIAVYNMSIWRDTVESIEYRHDVGYSKNSYANGAAPEGVINNPIIGTGEAAECITFQIGVYF